MAAHTAIWRNPVEFQYAMVPALHCQCDARILSRRNRRRAVEWVVLDGQYRVRTVGNYIGCFGVVIGTLKPALFPPVCASHDDARRSTPRQYEGNRDATNSAAFTEKYFGGV